MRKTEIIDSLLKSFCIFVTAIRKESKTKIMLTPKTVDAYGLR